MCMNFTAFCAWRTTVHSLSPKFAMIVEPLYQLLQKDMPYGFGSEQEAAFTQPKEKRASARTLAYIKRQAPKKVIANAIPVGLGTVLVQEQDGYTSRSGYLNSQAKRL